MMRERLNEALKQAMRAKDQRAVATLRLILAALKDRDIAARGKGVSEGVGEDEILSMLQSMIKQRRESIASYEQGGRLELAEQEADEIRIIEKFLPKQFSEEEIRQAVDAVVAEQGAESLKDMGGCMAALRANYAGQMDFAKASSHLKHKLGG